MSAYPYGLHVHLIAAGPTLRFAVWFERAMPGFAFKSFKRAAAEVPFAHPACVPHAEAPPVLPPAAIPVRALVTVPRLASLMPAPLPGLVTAWDLGEFRGTRGMQSGPSLVDAFVLPPSLSLQPLRRLLREWATRYGAGLVAPGARAALNLLDAMEAHLREGPLLPSLAPPDDAWAAPPRAPARYVNDDRTRAVWVPPVTLAEVQAMWFGLVASPRLAASLADERAAASWMSEAVPARLAVFLVEAFGAATERLAERPLAREAFRDERTRAGIAALHAENGSCLHPEHPALAPPAVPPGHMHGVLHPPDSDNQAWTLELGLLAAGGRFLPLRALLAHDALRHGAVERDGVVWFRPGAIVERDWNELAESKAWLFRRPELLVDGRCTVTEAEAHELIQGGAVQGLRYDLERWYRELDIDAPARQPKGFTAMTFGASAQGSAHVRVRWELAQGGRDGAMNAARFVPTLRVAVGDADLLAADAEKLLREAETGFVRVHGKLLDRATLSQAIEVLRAREKVLDRLKAREGLPWARALELDDAWSSDAGAVSTETRFAARWDEFLARLTGEGVPRRAPPAGFVGTLRPYQERGFAWMSLLVENGFGACLADDMGLGKTVQVLCLLAARREAPGGDARPSDLVVCPTAVALNWQREAAKFTPKLTVRVHAGDKRERDVDGLRAFALGADVVITTYGTLRRDHALFEALRWGVAVLDEAQNLKNPDSAQSRAAGAIEAEARIALTGTPVENHLRDLWSIYHVAVPGLLGSPARFARSFVTPSRQGDGRPLERLAKRVAPFLLRRTKADPGVAADLPARQEQDIYCELTPEQVALYRAMTEATLEGMADKDGIQRRAHILTALMRFKQICNHPENFVKERPATLFGRSGKLDRAMEILEELLDEGQRTLIFTQFTEMGDILARAIEERFGVEAGFYHGGLRTSEREALVAEFQSKEGSPVLILSLRAGGSGLNLQAASAVIHYDRWWNPAVEEQATGRAHRIGQTLPVNVYKFVTRATLEERIVTMLESKRDLAERVIATSDESWLTDMDERALREFLALDQGAGEA